VSYRLFAPSQFWELDLKTYILKCNGCGDNETKEVSKSLGISLDHILSVNVKPACVIHDWQYSSPTVLGIPPSEAHRMQCDRIFYENLLRIVDTEGVRLNSWEITKQARRFLCKTYYFLVRNFGGKAYWETNTTHSLEEKLWKDLT
jgi:hypothetical protein